jgi:NAD(P)-dependent dehydrogenase (short-subunit alcohol dehydrogenase family)
MTRRQDSTATGRTIAALAAGAALGATSAGGTALLLYTGQGFLRAAGLLIASTIMAVGAGIWAGGHDGGQSRPISTRLRWIGAIVAFAAGGLFAAYWGARAPLQSLAAGGAVAVLLVLALPAYTTGSLLAGLHARDRARLPRMAAGGVASAAVAGAAFGVLLATTVLIQTLEPHGLYYGAAALVSLASVLDWGTPPRPIRDGEISMNGHVSVITGVGRRGQFGYSLARRFVDAGARVVITDIGADVEAIAEELSEHGDVVAIRAQLLSDDGVESIMRVVRERFGRLDSLVNVAGGLTVVASIEDTTPEQWRREIERNAETALRMSRAALPLLRATSGAIINFASPAGERAGARLGAYSAAKAAVISLTRALALEERERGVRVNAIAPGVMDTEQNRTASGGEGTFVSRDEVADVVMFLVGPGARGVSGEVLHVLGRTLK